MALSHFNNFKDNLLKKKKKTFKTRGDYSIMEPDLQCFLTETQMRTKLRVYKRA